jgi:TetR/AcrR family transcriptional regulator, cholesterol catabolism regulator
MAELPVTGPPAPDTLIESQRKRRDRIVRAALRLLERREYDKIQVREVAEAADVALGTVYRYFASKEHLFAAVMQEWGASLDKRLRKDPLAGDDVASRLTDLMDRIITAFERRPQFFRLMVVMESTPDEHAQGIFDQFRARASQTVNEPLDALAPDDARAVLEVVNAVLSSVLRSWVMGSLTIGEVRRRMARSIELIFSAPPVPIADQPVSAEAG